MIPLVCFVGPSGVGKTLLLEKIVKSLKSRGLRVAVIKHAAHGFEIDHPGKDSWRLAEAGSDLIVLSSHRKMALIQKRKEEAPLEEIASLLEGRADIILAEGYKDSGKVQIEVFRSAVCQDLLSAKPEQLLAIVTDQKMPLDVPQFAFAEVDAIAGLIVKRTSPTSS